MQSLFNSRTRRGILPSTTTVLVALMSLVVFTSHMHVVTSADTIVVGEEQFDSPSHVATLTESDRGYRDLVIAIKDDVSEEEFSELVDELQDAFTAASEFMYRATRSLAYIKTVRILLPSAWRNSSDIATATWERYENSDVRISPASQNFPYTEKFTGCGLPGKYIGLTPDYVANRRIGGNALHDIYGTPNKVIVHEWGHYRWGLFDEYPRYASFYQDIDTGEIEATRCVLSIPGEIRNVQTGEPCGDDDLNSDGLPDSTKCVFYDDTDADTYSASIMYKQYLTNNEQFCDDPTKTGVPDYMAHNPMAPNEQNDKCQQRSAWEVLRAHPDFAGTDSLDPKPVESTVPEFVLVRQKAQSTTVLVLDKSGSMDGERLVLLQQAATNIIENILPIGSRLGIIAFNEYAFVLHPIVEIESTETRESLLDSLPRAADGRTSIGRGVELAVEELNKSEVNPAGSALIVITDGEQNASPYIADVLHQVDNLTITTVAVGGEADDDLELLSMHTGGDSFSHTDKSSEIYLSFFKAAAAQVSQSEITDTVIDADFTSLHISQTFTNKFYLDDALTGGLKITIAYIWSLSPTSIYFELSRPDGVMYNSFSRLYTTDNRYKQIKIDLGEEYLIAGEWTLNVTNEGDFSDDLNIVIQPRVKAGTTPILATAQWAVPTIVPPNRQILYVFVQEGDTPVINAEVNAVVTFNAGTTTDNMVTIEPHDDGIGADVTKDDGIYSAYFTNFLGKGRHGVEIQVTASSETKLANGAIVGYGAAANPLFATPEQPISFQPTGDFQREITGGSFECNSNVCGNSSFDLYPPGRITDLTGSLVNSQQFVLRFTAPGDDLADGNATRYEILYSSNFTEISREFDMSDMVPAHWITIGNVSTPQPAGTVEEFILIWNNTWINDNNITALIFGIVAIDDENNRSDRSNLVTIQQQLQSTTPASSMKGLSPGLIAGIALATCTLALCILVLVICVYIRISPAPSKTQSKEQSMYV